MDYRCVANQFSSAVLNQVLQWERLASVPQWELAVVVLCIQRASRRWGHALRWADVRVWEGALVLALPF